MEIKLDRIDPGPDFTAEQYLAQTEVYYSAGSARYEQIRFLPCPHAARARAKLERQAGFAVLETPLARALAAREESGIGAEVTEVPTIDGSARMLKDKRTGQFRGAYKPTASRARTI